MALVLCASMTFVATSSAASCDVLSVFRVNMFPLASTQENDDLPEQALVLVSPVSPMMKIFVRFAELVLIGNFAAVLQLRCVGLSPLALGVALLLGYACTAASLSDDHVEQVEPVAVFAKTSSSRSPLEDDNAIASTTSTTSSTAPSAQQEEQGGREKMFSSERSGIKRKSPSDEDDEAEGDEDEWAVSAEFRHDLVAFLRREFAPSGCNVAVELGVYKGHMKGPGAGPTIGQTTAVLAAHCSQVWALDDSSRYLTAATKRLAQLQQSKNVLFFRLHSYLDDWQQKLPHVKLKHEDEVSLFVLDCVHTRSMVLHDLERAHRLLKPKFAVVDDYGAHGGVFEAVQQFLAQGKARIYEFVGRGGKRTSEEVRADDGVTIVVSEGVILEMLFPDDEDPARVAEEISGPRTGNSGAAATNRNKTPKAMTTSTGAPDAFSPPSSGEGVPHPLPLGDQGGPKLRSEQTTLEQRLAELTSGGRALTRAALMELHGKVVYTVLPVSSVLSGDWRKGLHIALDQQSGDLFYDEKSTKPNMFFGPSHPRVPPSEPNMPVVKHRVATRAGGFRAAHHEDAAPLLGRGGTPEDADPQEQRKRRLEVFTLQSRRTPSALYEAWLPIPIPIPIPIPSGALAQIGHLVPMNKTLPVSNGVVVRDELNLKSKGGGTFLLLSNDVYDAIIERLLNLVKSSGNYIAGWRSSKNLEHSAKV